MKKEIFLKCVSNLSDALYMIKVIKNNHVICTKCVCENEILTLRLKYFSYYTILVHSCKTGAMCQFNAFITEYYPTTYVVAFNHLPSYTMTLTDKYYPGLPIKKGELILCQ